MQLETERLILKPITEDDWLFFEALHQSRDVMRFISDPSLVSEIRARFESRLIHWTKSENSWLALIIIEKSTGNKIGITGFYSEWKPYEQAELGFLLATEFHGKGFAKESTLTVLDFAFNTCGFHKATATITEGNNSSFGLLKRLGFSHDGTLRDNFKLSGKWCNDLKLSLLRSEYNVM